MSDPFHDDDIEYLRDLSHRDKPFYIPVPKVACPRCGALCRLGSLRRPFWREDGPEQCSGCTTAEKRGTIAVLGHRERERKEYVAEMKKRRKQVRG